jgi:hypothetical protein
MRLRFIVCSAVLSILSALPSAAQQPPVTKTNVLVITGGHGFEREPFFKLFKDNPDITFTAAEHAKGGATAWERDDLTNFNAVVLYDMAPAITEAQKEKLLSLFTRGTGLVVLHHALASFQAWPEYARIIGGLYPLAKKGQPASSVPSGYQHGVDLTVTVADKAHPITTGLRDFTIHDEIYWGYRVGADVHPLLTTPHPKSGNPLMWTRLEGQSRVVYLQLGHDHLAYENPAFRQLVARSIAWAASR